MGRYMGARFKAGRIFLSIDRYTVELDAPITSRHMYTF